MNNLRYLKPLFSFILIGLLINTLSRIFLFFIFKERVVETENFFQIYTIGLRFDLIILCYLSVLPFILLTFLPSAVLDKMKKFFNIYFIFFLFLLLLMELLLV